MRATIGSSSATVPLLSGSSNRTSPLSSGISAWKFQLIDVTENKEYMDGMVVKHTPGAEGASAPPLHPHTHPSTRIATIIKELVKNKNSSPFQPDIHPDGGGWRRAARPSPLRGISICFVTPHQGPRVRDCHLQHMSTTLIEARLQYKKTDPPPDRLSFRRSLPGPLGPARPGRARGP